MTQKEAAPFEKKTILKKVLGIRAAYYRYGVKKSNRFAVAAAEIGITLSFISLFWAIWSYLNPYDDGSLSKGLRTTENNIVRRVYDILHDHNHSAEPLPPVLPIPKPPPQPIPVPPPDPELPRSDARLAALRLAAENWRHRTGPDFQDFLQSKNAITQYDKNRFTSDDSVDFDILTSAENLIKWREKGLNASTKEELPIYIKISHSNTVEDRLSIALKKELTENGFKIVDDALKAALFIEFTEGNETIPFLNQAKNQWQATTSYVLKFTWLGGAQMIPDTEQSITKSGADGDEAYNSSFKAASKTASEKFLLLTNPHY